MKQLVYRKVVKYSAIYDVVMTFAFAFPVLVVWNIGLFSTIHAQYSFSGSIYEGLRRYCKRTLLRCYKREYPLNYLEQ